MHPLIISATFFFFLAILLSDRVVMTANRLMWERSETYRKQHVGLFRKTVLDGEDAPRLNYDVARKKDRLVRFLVFAGLMNLFLAQLSGVFSSPKQLAATLTIMVLLLTFPLYLYIRLTQRSKLTNRRILKVDPLNHTVGYSAKPLLKSWAKTWLHFFLYLLAYAIGQQFVLKLINIVW